MSEPVVTFQNVFKKYARGEQHGTLRDFLAASVGRWFGKGVDPTQLKGEEFWAVKDLSFSLKKGESMGIIGPNGSGKSTTLKLLSGILKPDRGTYSVKGRLSALIEVGAGFHPDLTGRENVYLNGSILGMTRKETRAKFADIVDFSGVAEFIDTPVKRYSSGMAVRLGFAVAAFIEPEVLLVDEVLAVGDTEFRSRCQHRMDQMLRKGVTLILVSHNLNEVKNLCDTTLMLWKGEKVNQGPTNKVLEEYYHRVVEMIEMEEGKAALRAGPGPEKAVSITGVKFVDKNGVPTDNFFTGDPMTVRVEYEARRRVEKPVFAVEIEWAADDLLLTKLDTRTDGVNLRPLEPGRGHFDLKLGPLLMEPNVYTVSARIEDAAADEVLDMVHRNRFVLNEQTVVSGFYALPHEWEQGAQVKVEAA
ncbi:MAG TPA: ABC transporter ATP-binding protein [Tepidisphaeraceae bacterium]|nr:ABC transporter ATP-binding protein [Tepidisphaeraceae bacterium]